MKSQKFFGMFFFYFFILLFLGCGKPSLETEGTVDWDGAPLESGSISFEPKNAKGRDFGGIIQDGKFKLTSPPGEEPGIRIVRIQGMKKTGKKIPAGAPFPPGTMIDETVNVPKKYNEKSELTADFSSNGPNQLNFKIETSSK